MSASLNRRASALEASSGPAMVADLSCLSEAERSQIEEAYRQHRDSAGNPDLSSMSDDVLHLIAGIPLVAA